MAKYIVEFHGQVEVEANSSFEAECTAAFECRPDNCKAIIRYGEDGAPEQDLQ